MIDCENEVFSTVANAVRKAYPSVFISGEYTLIFNLTITESSCSCTFRVIELSLI